MRYFFKKSIPIVVILSLSGILFFGYNSAIARLKAFISVFSEKNYNAKLSIGDVNITVPVSLELKEVAIADAIYIKKIKLYPDITSFFFKDTFIISKIEVVEPVIKVEKGGGRLLAILARLDLEDLYPLKIEVKDGSLIYGGENGAFELVKIKGVIQGPRFYFSENTPFRFKMAGFFKNKDSDFLSPFEFLGNIEPDNVVKAELNCNDMNIDSFGNLYSRYLTNFMDSGKVDLKSDILISDMTLNADCLLTAEDITLKKDIIGRIDTPLIVSFILFFNFKDKILKFKDLRSNFSDFIRDISRPLNT